MNTIIILCNINIPYLFSIFHVFDSNAVLGMAFTPTHPKKVIEFCTVPDEICIA